MNQHFKSFEDLQKALASRSPKEPRLSDEAHVASFLKEGFVKLTAEQMSLVLRVCAYEHQRKLNRQHVESLANLMDRDKWVPRSQLDFGLVVGHPLPFLVNGNHRGHSQVLAGKTIEWSIVIHPCATTEELGQLYCSFDTNIAKRTNAQILDSLEFAQREHLHKETASALYKAVPFIASRFSMKQTDRDLPETRLPDLRAGVAREYAAAARIYEQCFEGTRLKGKLLSAGCMAVAVVTLRWCGDPAVAFWTGVAQNDGLRRGDPRQALVNDLLQQKRRQHTGNLVPAAIAWNAYYKNRELRLIRYSDDIELSIDGTPFSKNWKRRRNS